MKESDFYAVANEMFGNVLIPLGFTNKGTNRCTFYRKVGYDVHHFIMPCLGSRGAWYQIYVFPQSPSIDPLFDGKFPDNLGIPTDNYSLLSEYDGVSVTQQQFNCKYETSFRDGFAAKVAPLLLRVAVPYLDRFQKVADILPAIRHPSFLGFALRHVGRTSEALVALKRERDRLAKLDTTNEDVAVLLQHIERHLREM